MITFDGLRPQLKCTINAIGTFMMYLWRACGTFEYKLVKKDSKDQPLPNSAGSIIFTLPQCRASLSLSYLHLYLFPVLTIASAIM